MEYYIVVKRNKLPIIDKSQIHTECKQPDIREHILYDSVHVTLYKRQNDAKKKLEQWLLGFAGRTE